MNGTKRIKAVSTKAYGHFFRSRLEARWAVAFTTEKIDWVYEPEGFDLDKDGWYLPDFWLPQVSMWAEVKASVFTEQELRKAARLAVGTGHPCLLLVGVPSDYAYWAVLPQSSDLDDEWAVDCGGYRVEVMDYRPFEGGYHLDEQRFFSCTGSSPDDSFPMPHDLEKNHPKSVIAALSARFEHGQSYFR